MAASCHDHAGDELRRRWDGPRLLREGDHPVIFAGAGSHAGGFEAGDVVVSVALPVLRRIVEGAARAWRWLAPWSRWSPPAGAFGLPFVDYLRGDGTAVGPGQAQAWEACVVSDATPWVRDYCGLWGLDTHDVFGGERAPAGPRYERGGAVRASWADPLGWAGLRRSRPAKRPRMLRVWGALSTPLLVGTIVVLLLGPPLAFLSSIVLFVVLFLGIEAAARARLLPFLVGLALTAVTLALAAVVVTGLLQNWRAVLAALLGLVALVLLVVNVRELRR